MDNHPIPQDVTGFKFRIIGSITVKQFLYLLASGIAATLLIFFIPINLFAKVPLVILLGGIGPFFAFIPIEGRPADMMLANFFKAVMATTLYTYQKQGANLALYPMLSPAPMKTAAQTNQQSGQSKADVKRALLARTLRSSKYAPDSDEVNQIHRINDFFSDSPPSGNILNSPAIAKPPGDTQADLNNGSAPPSTSIDTTASQPAPQTVMQSSPQPLPSSPSLVVESVSTSETGQSTNASVPSPASVDGEQKTQDASSVPSDAQSVQDEDQQPAFGHLPDRGNVVMGVVQDPRGKALGGIIVEVEDSEGTPVRAFKTNMGGQFAAATPLTNGVFTIKFEDPRGQHAFATMKVELNGAIFQPIRVVSEDERERLRQNLFGAK